MVLCERREMIEAMLAEVSASIDYESYPPLSNFLKVNLLS